MSDLSANQLQPGLPEKLDQPRIPGAVGLPPIPGKTGLFQKGGKGGPGRPKKKRAEFENEMEELLQGDACRTNALKELQKILIGYKGVRASDKLAAIKLLIEQVQGKPTEHVIQENLNTDMKEYSANELASRAAELLREIEAKDASGEGK